MLADRIGVSKEYLSQIENGQKSGTVDIYRRLSNVLDVELDDKGKSYDDTYGNGSTRCSPPRA